MCIKIKVPRRSCEEDLKGVTKYVFSEFISKNLSQ